MQAQVTCLDLLLFSPIKRMGIEDMKTTKSLNSTIKAPNRTQKDENLKWYNFKIPDFNLKLTKVWGLICNSIKLHGLVLTLELLELNVKQQL